MRFTVSSCLVLAVLTTFCFVFGKTATSKNPKHETCERDRSCGSVSVKYPFWIKNETCGHKGFEIECNNSQPLFDLVFGRFPVKEVNTSDRSMQLWNVPNTAYSDPTTCLPNFLYSNKSDRHHLSNRKMTLSFFYRCNSPLFSSDQLTIPLNSSSVRGQRSYVALTSSGSDDVWLLVKNGTCESHFFSQIKSEDCDFGDAAINCTRFFKRNFTLRWTSIADDYCEVCRSSGGECGSAENGEFQCFCSDHDSPSYCIKGKNDRPLKIGLGAGIGALASIVVLMSIFMLRFRKMQAASRTLSKNNSAANSLMSDLEGSHVYFEIPIFRNKELEEATNNFHSSQELGDGGFGTVYYGKLRDGREVAVKRLYEHNIKRVKQFMTEVQILTRLNHKNLVSLYGCTSRQSRELLLVYEYVPNGTVADHLHGDRANNSGPPILWPVRMNIAIETAEALSYLHASDIIHRDVKTHNILLDNNFSVKVGDFGLSRLFPNDVTHVSTAPQGTPGYVDPEYHLCYQLTEKSDVYSFGVVLIELVSSLPAVDISRDRHEINLANLAINKIKNRKITEIIDPRLGFGSDVRVTEEVNGVIELAFMCLQQEKDMRPSMVEVVEGLKAIAAKRNTRFTPSPESDSVVLLKKANFPTSPISVTQKWVSSSSSCTPSTSA